MRKGQGAMEYLMTYGWALLVIIIVGAALFALGVLNPQTYQQKRCNGFQYFQYINHVYDATGDTFTLHIRNGVNDITLDQITVDGATDASFVVGDIVVDGTNLDPVTSTINQGQEIVILGDAVGTLSAGAYDDVVVTVQYDAVNGITDVTDTATCVGNAV